MKNKILFSFLCPLILFFTHTYPAWPAIVMRGDGVSLECTVDGEQAILVKTSSEERTIKFKNIVWMAGQDLKRVRISGDRKTVSGEVRNNIINIKCTAGDMSIPLQDMVFYHKEDVDLKKTEGMRIEEYDGTSSTETFPKTERSGTFKVTLMPEYWEGGIEISEPAYPKEVSSKDDVVIDLWVKGDGNAYKNLAEKTPMLKFGFRFEGYIYRRMEHVGTIKGNAVNTNYVDFAAQRDSNIIKGEVLKRIKLTLKEPFKDFSSVKHAYLFVTGFMQTEEFARGNLKVDRTCSNVLKLDLGTKFEFPFEFKKR